MDIHSFLSELKNLSPDKQIAKLKALKKNVSQEQIVVIEQASKEAGQPWLASALLDIVNSKKRVVLPKTQAEPQEDTIDLEAIRSEAVSDSIGQILHELEPILGSINLLAKQEITNFDNSRVKNELELLNETIETFENWRKVEQPPKYKHSNVYDVIQIECSRLAPKSSVELTLNISSDLEFNLDPSLLRIIVSNAIRNSVEACKVPTIRAKKPIIINGSTTDKSLWISIIDDGVGLQGKSEELMKSRFTTKPGNRGLGLALIDKAVKSLNGKWHLVSSKPNGTEFSFEVPIKEF